MHTGFPASILLRTALLSVVRSKIEAGILHARHASSGPLSQSSSVRHSSVLVIDPDAQAPPSWGSPWLTIRRDLLTQKGRRYRNRLAHGELVGVTATGSHTGGWWASPQPARTQSPVLDRPLIKHVAALHTQHHVRDREAALTCLLCWFRTSCGRAARALVSV